MDKKTKLYLGIGLLGAGVFLYFKSSKNMVGFVKSKPKSITSKNTKCKFYSGSCDSPVGTIITDWEAGGVGIIVSSSSTQCMICTKSPNTPDGMPKQF